MSLFKNKKCSGMVLTGVVLSSGIASAVNQGVVSAVPQNNDVIDTLKSIAGKDIKNSDDNVISSFFKNYWVWVLVLVALGLISIAGFIIYKKCFSEGADVLGKQENNEFRNDNLKAPEKEKKDYERIYVQELNGEIDEKGNRYMDKEKEEKEEKERRIITKMKIKDIDIKSLNQIKEENGKNKICNGDFDIFLSSVQKGDFKDTDSLIYLEYDEQGKITEIDYEDPEKYPIRIPLYGMEKLVEYLKENKDVVVAKMEISEIDTVKLKKWEDSDEGIFDAMGSYQSGDVTDICVDKDKNGNYSIYCTNGEGKFLVIRNSKKKGSVDARKELIDYVLANGRVNKQGQPLNMDNNLLYTEN